MATAGEAGGKHARQERAHQKKQRRDGHDFHRSSGDFHREAGVPRRPRGCHKPWLPVVHTRLCWPTNPLANHSGPPVTAHGKPEQGKCVSCSRSGGKYHNKPRTDKAIPHSITCTEHCTASNQHVQLLPSFLQAADGPATLGARILCRTRVKRASCGLLPMLPERGPPDISYETFYSRLYTLQVTRR